MKIKFKRIDHLQICVPRDREAEARQFYIHTLGLPEIPKPADLLANGGFWLKIAGIELHIGVEDVIHPSKRHPAFVVEDLQGIRDFLQAQGVRVKDYNPLPLYHRFSFFDPFGNRIELLEER